LLEGTHPLRSPEDLQHHALIHDESTAFEDSFPTWRSWLQSAGFVNLECEPGLQINDPAVIQAAIAEMARRSAERHSLAET
jgi:LysR family glycine cleavage system transcriptional activator